VALGGASVDSILVTAFVHVQAIAAIFLFTVIKYKIILEIYEYATTKDFFLYITCYCLRTLLLISSLIVPISIYSLLLTLNVNVA